MFDQSVIRNIPILPKAFLTFASKSSIGPSYATYGPYTPCTLYREDIAKDTLDIAQDTSIIAQHT